MNIPGQHTMMSVELEAIRFHAHHGVFPNEKKIGNQFTLWLSLTYQISLEEISDNLEDTVSYADLFDICRHEMSIPSKLLEDVVARIARRATNLTNKWVEINIRLRKDSPPISGIDGAASVKLKINNLSNI